MHSSAFIREDKWPSKPITPSWLSIIRKTDNNTQTQPLQVQSWSPERGPSQNHKDGLGPSLLVSWWLRDKAITGLSNEEWGWGFYNHNTSNGSPITFQQPAVMLPSAEACRLFLLVGLSHPGEKHSIYWCIPQLVDQWLLYHLWMKRGCREDFNPLLYWAICVTRSNSTSHCLNIFLWNDTEEHSGDEEPKRRGRVSKSICSPTTKHFNYWQQHSVTGVLLNMSSFQSHNLDWFFNKTLR